MTVQSVKWRSARSRALGDPAAGEADPQPGARRGEELGADLLLDVLAAAAGERAGHRIDVDQREAAAGGEEPLQPAGTGNARSTRPVTRVDVASASISPASGSPTSPRSS